MDEEEWEKFIAHLDNAQTELRSAAALMDGIEGWTEAGEAACVAAMSAIDAAKAAEIAYRERSGSTSD